MEISPAKGTLASMDAEVRGLGDIADPAERARIASDLVLRYQSEVTEISRIRREALDELISGGMTHADIAKKIGTTRARVTQLLSSGPRPERAFLGSGTLTVAIGGKLEQGRRDQASQPVVSSEAMKAYEVLCELSRSLSLQATMEVVPPPGMVNLNRTNLVVLTSPRLLPFIGQVLEADSRYGFAMDERGLHLIDRETGTEYRSPQDDTGEASDYAYVGRLPRPDGRGNFLYLAGIHAAGTLGAARFIEQNLPDLYRDLKTKRFSVLIKARFSPETRELIEVSQLTPLQRHEGV